MEPLHVGGVELVATKDIHGPRIMMIVQCAPVEAVTTLDATQAKKMLLWLQGFMHDRGAA